MSKHAAYTPRHRGQAQRPVVDGSKRAARKFFVLSAVAVAGTGAAVGGGVALHQHGASATEASQLTPVALPVSSSERPTVVRDRSQSLSRSADRTRLDPAKAASLGVVAGSDHSAVTKTENMESADPQSIAAAMMAKYGWNGSQFSCLVSLWTRESNWNVHAENPSGAYGIPQSLPGSKMASAGPDWENNPVTQISWGLGYISERYGSPCGAWGHSEATGWY